LERAAASALSLCEEGDTCLKTGPYPLAPRTADRGQPSFQGPIALNPHAIVRRSGARMKAMREAVGDDVDIQFDCHGVFTPVMAVEFARRVEEYRPMFLEEATQA